MAEINVFEVAARKKYRFPYKGSISVEELWDCSVEDLDKIFKTLNASVKQEKEESLLAKKTEANQELDNKIDIIKHIVGTKVIEANARAAAREKREQKQKILSILADKQDKALQDKSVEELQAMLDNLE